MEAERIADKRSPQKGAKLPINYNESVVVILDAEPCSGLKAVFLLPLDRPIEIVEK